MKGLVISILLLSSSTAAAQMSPVGCNALSASADEASAKLEDVLSHMDSPAFRKAMPYMPTTAQDEAANLENAKVAAQLALLGYQRALKAFSTAIHNCGQ